MRRRDRCFDLPPESATRIVRGPRVQGLPAGEPLPWTQQTAAASVCRAHCAAAPCCSRLVALSVRREARPEAVVWFALDVMPEGNWSGAGTSTAHEPRLGLIRFRGHFPKGGYDVHDANTPPKRRAPRKFTEDFKQQAARLVLDDGKSMAAVARELDLVPTALREWVERARADSHRRADGADDRRARGTGAAPQGAPHR